MMMVYGHARAGTNAEYSTFAAWSKYARIGTYRGDHLKIQLKRIEPRAKDQPLGSRVVRGPQEQQSERMQ